MSRLNRIIVTAVAVWTLIGASTIAVRSLAAPAASGDEKARAKFEVYKDRGGDFRWRLRATNTQILAISGDGYKAKRDCMNAIESVKRDVVNAPVEDTSDAQGQPGANGQGAANGQERGQRSDKQPAKAGSQAK